MGKIAACTGGIGDIVYSIPVLRKLQVTTLYVKENFYPEGLGSMHSVLKPLLEKQGFECLPTSGAYPFSCWEPGLKFDYDMDAWRCRPGRDRIHIIKNMLLYFRLSLGEWNKPFLKDYLLNDLQYNLIFLSPRWRENSKVSWNKVLHMATYSHPCYFIGHPEDYENFIKEYGYIPHRITRDLNEMAITIANCHALYTNQSVALTIAQGLGKTYYLEVKPTKTNTLFYTPNENILR